MLRSSLRRCRFDLEVTLHSCRIGRWCTNGLRTHVGTPPLHPRYRPMQPSALQNKITAKCDFIMRYIRKNYCGKNLIENTDASWAFYLSYPGLVSCFFESSRPTSACVCLENSGSWYPARGVYLSLYIVHLRMFLPARAPKLTKFIYSTLWSTVWTFFPTCMYDFAFFTNSNIM